MRKEFGLTRRDAKQAIGPSLANDVRDLERSRGAHVHVVPYGKCERVLAQARTALIANSKRERASKSSSDGDESSVEDARPVGEPESEEVAEVYASSANESLVDRLQAIERMVANNAWVATCWQSQSCMRVVALESRVNKLEACDGSSGYDAKGDDEIDKRLHRLEYIAAVDGWEDNSTCSAELTASYEGT